MVLQLRKVREARGMSLLRLCLLTGIESGTLSRIERQLIFPYLGWRRRISAALGVPEEELFRPVEEVKGDNKGNDNRG